MKQDHVHDLIGKRIHTPVDFVDVGFDQFANSVLRDIHRVHIQDILPSSLEVGSRCYFFGLIPLQERETDVENQEVSMSFRLIVKLKDLDDFRESLNK